MTKITVAIFGICGLIVSMGPAQTVADGGADAQASSGSQGSASPASGFHYGPLSISPELDVSYFHDTNPTYTEHGAKAVDAIKMQPLLDLILTGNGWSVDARGWMTHDMYLGSVDPMYKDTIEKDHYGESLGFNLTTPRETHYSLTEMFEYQNRNDFVLGPAINPGSPINNPGYPIDPSNPGGTYNYSWGDRYSFAVGGAMDTKLGEKTGMSAGASFSDLWYSNPLLYGWQDVGGTLGFNRKLTEKSDLVLDFGYDSQWSDGDAGQSHSYRALVGLGSRPDAVSSYRAEVGVMGYDYNNGTDTAYSPTYSLSGNWRLSQRLSANLNGTANYQPSETDQNNYTLVDTISAGLTYQATTRLTTSLNAIYRREDYAKEDPGATKKRLDNQFDLYGRANYRFYRYASVFVGADVSKDVSSGGGTGNLGSGDSYNRLFLEAGVSLRF